MLVKNLPSFDFEPTAIPQKKIRKEIRSVMMLDLNDPNRLEVFRKYAAIYGRFDSKRKNDRPWSLFQISVNEAAAQLCNHLPALLLSRLELFPLAKQVVRDSGAIGRSRAAEVLVQPKIKQGDTIPSTSSLLATINQEENSRDLKSQESSQPDPYRLTENNIQSQRPQLSFQDKIDNSSFPFKPQLRKKPNALRPLEESLKLPEGVSLDQVDNPMFVYPHPYEFELESFKLKGTVFQRVVPKTPLSLDSTPFTIVETKDQFLEMIEHIRTQTEIGVDLEHHSYRTFQGLTCLMQISTRFQDYIIDTLALRSETHLINEIFTDPNITKVFHGADVDIRCLQRDFSVYVISMFDTSQAARVLGFSRFSLAHLLMKYCRFEADKKFQLADWRIRPLPAELINYAREDTHYLLYIFDMMKNQLIDSGDIQNNLLMSVFDRSKEVAAKVYQKPMFTPQDYMELYKKSGKSFNNQQLAALQEIYAWRDSIARLEDESLGYVLPNRMMLQIAEILPQERQDVLACCDPIPPLVKENLIELHNMILKARDLTPSKPGKPSNVQQQQMNLALFGRNLCKDQQITLFSDITCRKRQMEASSEEDPSSPMKWVKLDDECDNLLAPGPHLLSDFKKLEEDNDALRNKVTDLESKLKDCKYKLAEIDTESLGRKCLGLLHFDGNDLPKIYATERDWDDLKHILSEGERKIQRLEMDKRIVTEHLKKFRANTENGDKELRREITRLKYQVLTLDEEKRVLMMDSQKKPQQVECDRIQLLQDKLAAVTETLQMTRQQMQEALESSNEKNKDLMTKYLQELKIRKAYHNQLVEMRGNIRVYCRIRPVISKTLPILKTDTFDDGVIFIKSKLGKNTQFQMDKVFNMEISQTQIFEDVSSLVRSAIDGFNVCIFAYGQTGAGKTYTMEGSPSDPGVNQRALKFLYEQTENTSWEYSVEASMLEIYNESIRDLLSPDPQGEKFEVKLKPEGGVHVPGLVIVPVQSLDEINKIFETGRRNRSTAATCMNERSSRSHSLLCVTVEGLNLMTGSKTHGRLNLVDLAGSERVSKSHVDGARLKEAQNINKSLSCLGDVISALKNKHSHIPYRNSKLTYLLQESLGGDSKTLMILQVSPEEKNVSESFCTLSFGQRVRSAELGAATRKMDDDGKNTPSMSKRLNNETPKLQTPM